MEPPVLLAMAFRSRTRPAKLRAALAQIDAALIALSPLTAGDSARLIAKTGDRRQSLPGELMATEEQFGRGQARGDVHPPVAVLRPDQLDGFRQRLATAVVRSDRPLCGRQRDEHVQPILRGVRRHEP